MLDRQLHALVAEDNAALRRVIALSIRKAGFQVTAAEDGLVAWNAAQEQSYDLVVSDQQMPNLDGLGLIAKLRESDSLRHTPIILLTAKGLELEIEQIRQELGVAAVLTKPFSPAQLASLAQELVAESV